MSNRQLKERVWRRDGVRCRYCGTQLAIPPRGLTTHDPRYATVDHIVPKAKGGPMSFRNLLTACSPCNAKKADQAAWDFRYGQP